MIVYIEYIIFDNLAIDTLLLVATLFTLGEKPKYRRVLLASLLGTVFAVLQPYLQLNGVIFVALKILLSILIILIVRKHGTIREYLRTMLFFYMYSFLLGGISFAFLSARIAYGSIIYSGKGYAGIVAVSVLIFIYIARQAVAYISNKSTSGSCSVEIYVNGKPICVNAIIDSGNIVYTYDLKPVIFISEDLKGIDCIKINEKVDIVTITGANQLDLIIIPQIKVLSKGKVKFYKDVYAAIPTVCMKSCKIILHNEMGKECVC